jgi:hypothetical protein
LFYRDFSGSILGVAVAASPAFAPGEVTKIIDGSSYHGGGPFGGGRTYDLSRDGTRFLMIKRELGESSTPSFVVVVNWSEELKQRVPKS